MSAFQYIGSAPHRTVQIQQKEWLYFSGTAYLGMQSHPDFLKLYAENLSRYGSNFGGSRHSNIRFKIIEEAEQLLANLATAPAAVTFSSGTLAGQILIQYLQQLQLSFYYAPNTHPALLQTSTTTPPFSYSEWTKEITRLAHRQNHPFLLLCNAIDPLYATPTDFKWLWDLPKEQQYILVVDDSHGIGITGVDGGGFYQKEAIPDWVEVIVIASLGKAFGISGGVILGNKKRIAALQKTTFFSSSSPISPAALATFVAAQPLYVQQRILLQKRIEQFNNKDSLTQMNSIFQYLPHYPVFYTEYSALASYLAKAEMMISQFPYPSSQDTPITRVILSAAHTEADIKQLQDVLNNFPIL